MRRFRDGTGDIAMTVAPAQRIAFLINWPHLKPGRFTRPEPSFRALNDAAEAARILGGALAAEAMPQESPSPVGAAPVLASRAAAAAAAAAQAA
jgi:hypothetical protein